MVPTPHYFAHVTIWHTLSEALRAFRIVRTMWTYTRFRGFTALDGLKGEEAAWLANGSSTTNLRG